VGFVLLDCLIIHRQYIEPIMDEMDITDILKAVGGATNNTNLTNGSSLMSETNDPTEYHHNAVTNLFNNLQQRMPTNDRSADLTAKGTVSDNRLMAKENVSAQRHPDHNVSAKNNQINEVLKSLCNSRSMVNRPVDPVNSVQTSSAEYQSPVDNVREHSNKPERSSHTVGGAEALSRKSLRSNDLKNDLKNDVSRKQTTDKKVGKTVHFNNHVDEHYDDVDATSSENTLQVTPSGINMTSLMGYNIPTSTLYFIIVLIVIAVALYFLTAKKKDRTREKDREKDREKEKDD
jgi:hypothetical protein